MLDPASMSGDRERVTLFGLQMTRTARVAQWRDSRTQSFAVSGPSRDHWPDAQAVRDWLALAIQQHAADVPIPPGHSDYADRARATPRSPIQSLSD